MSDSKAELNAALDDLRMGFNADGADLEVVEAGDTAVTVRLVITEETCLECIVPKPVLVQILQSSVRKKFPNIQTVELIDPRETTSV